MYSICIVGLCIVLDGWTLFFMLLTTFDTAVWTSALGTLVLAISITTYTTTY